MKSKTCSAKTVPVKNPPESYQKQEFLALFHSLRDNELRYYLTANLRSVADVDDLVHDIFIKINEMDDDLIRNIQHPKRYLFQMAGNAAKTLLSKNQRLMTSGDEASAVINELDCPNSSPERVLEGEQLSDLLLQAIADMPATRRQVLLLYRFRGLSRNELATELGMTLSAVDKNLVRAFQQLKDWLEKETDQ